MGLFGLGYMTLIGALALLDDQLSSHCALECMG